MDIYYEHDKRKIIDESGVTRTFQEAVDGVSSGMFDNWNMAFNTLVRFGGDMDAVEEYYKQDK